MANCQSSQAICRLFAARAGSIGFNIRAAIADADSPMAFSAGELPTPPKVSSAVPILPSVQ